MRRERRGSTLTDWFSGDEPLWNWRPDPYYMSLRKIRIAQAYRDSWRALISDPNVRFVRFVNTGIYEPRT